MIINFRKVWQWVQNEGSREAAAPAAPMRGCPACATTAGQSLTGKLKHLVQAHLDAEERWLLKLLLSNYHVNDLCAVLGIGPDAVRNRIVALRVRILTLLNQQQADDTVKRAFHRLVSGPWF
ncbi:MAG: hypothetical protein HYR55_02295 [Acidobacteria bacterium]|nr:hypothetical protein [Acidobacteriota bacterium]MBI3655724.1 hypothetical protein [Acidobacteriota bacterium]